MSASPPPAAPLLEPEGLEKRFGNALALSGVSFNLGPTEVHALCGENGAGKSTLIKVLCGIYPAGTYEGRILMAGEPVEFRTIADSKRRGIAVIHQELALVPEMTVAENIFLGNEPRTRFGTIDRTRMTQAALEVMGRLKIQLDPTARANTLGIGQQQLVEVSRALVQNPRILILDEPTAALNERETQELMRVIRDTRGSGSTCPCPPSGTSRKRASSGSHWNTSATGNRSASLRSAPSSSAGWETCRVATSRNSCWARCYWSTPG